MAEEIVEEQKETATEESVAVEPAEEPQAAQVDVNPIEELAKKMGWNPEHDESDGRTRLSAEDFILKSREIQNTASKHIKRQAREIAELKNGIEGLKQHNQAVYKAHIAQLKRQVSELQHQRAVATSEGNDAAVREIDSQIHEINKIPTELPETGNTLHPDFVDWLDDNDWYEADNDLRAYADMLGNQPEYRAMAQKNYKGMLQKVEGIVRKMFPDKFGAIESQPQVETKQVKAQRAPVESGTRRQAPIKSTLKYNDLTREQQDMCDFFVRQGVMTREQYIADLEIRHKEGV